MLKKRWYIWPITGLFLLGLILGSFLDLKINEAIYDRTNWFGLMFSAFGETPFYASLGIFGYGFFYLVGKYKNKAVKVALIIGIIASFGVSVYFQGKHIFDVNAFNNKSLYWLGFLIAALLYALGAVAGYFLFRHTEVSPGRITLVLLALVVACGLSVGINQLLKIIMSRPRFRFLYEENLLSSFKNWWQNGKELKETYVNTPWTNLSGLITKEEFKSFPSGHMSSGVPIIIILCSLPLLNNKIKVKQEVFLVIACVWNVLLAYSRMRMGAHFLSDVSMGALLGLISIIIVNEIYIKLDKKFFKEESEPRAV